jgi:hypothetical protein
MSKSFPEHLPRRILIILAIAIALVTSGYFWLAEIGNAITYSDFLYPPSGPYADEMKIRSARYLLSAYSSEGIAIAAIAWLSIKKRLSVIWKLSISALTAALVVLLTDLAVHHV